MNTISQDRFYRVTQTLIKIQSTDKLSPKKTSATELTLEKTVIEVLFKLFYYSYTKIPSTYLKHVLNSFIELIKKSNEQIQLLALQLFSNISFDIEGYICIKDCSVSSYLNLKESTRLNATPDRIAVVILNLIDNVKDNIAGLEVLIALARSHYAVKALDLNTFLTNSLDFSSQCFKEEEVMKKVEELVELIVLQKGPSSDTKLILNESSWLIISFNNFIEQVENLFLTPSTEVFEILTLNEETKKGKRMTTQFTEVAILLMRIMSKIVYIGNEEIPALVERYIFFLKQYIEQSVIDKKIVNEIQYFITQIS
jgi:hypothetical protein